MSKLFRRAKITRHSLTQNSQNEKPLSYYSNQNFTKIQNQSATKTTDARLTQLKKFLAKIPGLLAGLFIFISLIYGLTIEYKPKVNLVTASSTVSVLSDTSKYEEATIKLLKSSIFNHTKLTINTTSLEKQLLEQFPELERAEISLPISRRRPIVNLYPKSLKLALITGDNKFAVDQNGIASIVLEKLDGLKLPIVKDESSIAAGLGKPLLTRAEVEFISTLYYQLVSSKLVIKSLSLPALPSELHLKLAGEPYYVKFNLQSDAREAVGTFLAAKSKIEKDKLSIKYIDVRLPGKAFYK